MTLGQASLIVDRFSLLEYCLFAPLAQCNVLNGVEIIMESETRVDDHKTEDSDSNHTIEGSVNYWVPVAAGQPHLPRLEDDEWDLLSHQSTVPSRTKFNNSVNAPSEDRRKDEGYCQKKRPEADPHPCLRKCGILPVRVFPDTYRKVGTGCCKEAEGHNLENQPG